MPRTSKQIEGDVYQLLRNSTLSTQISGGVYRNGQRPPDSCKEDVVVSFTAGLPSQIETGVVTINIFVPDIDPYESGVKTEDGERTEQIELFAQQWVDSLKANKYGYRFELQQTIATDYEESINQHFVVVRLSYRYFGG